MNIWIAGKDLMKLYCLIKKSFTVNQIQKIYDYDYEHVQKVWEVFGMKNIGEYQDLYV